MRVLTWFLLLSLGLGRQVGRAQQLAWERPLDFASLTSKTFGYEHQLGNGDFLVSGAGGNGNVFYPFIYARVQPDGVVVYQRTGRTLATLEQDVAPLGGGGALLAASVPTRGASGNGSSKLFFQRLQANGDTLPGRSYPASVVEGWPTRVVREGDSLRVLAFDMSASPQGLGYFALLSTDTLGQLGRVRRYPNPILANGYPCDLVRTARGGWLLVGELAGTPYSHPYLVETDAQGRFRRQRHPLLFAGSTGERVRRSFNNLVRLRDGSGYVFSGWQQTSTQILGFVCKVDTALNVVWAYRHPPQATAYLNPSRVYELADGSLLLLASEAQTGAPTTFYLVHVSAGGQLLGQQVVSSACSRLVPYCWQPLAGGSLLVVGGLSTCAATGTASVAYVARIDQALPLATATPAAGSPAGAQLWPNPARASEGVSWQGAVPAGAARAELLVLNALGRAVRRAAVAGRGPQVTQAVGLAGLAPGAYAVRLLVDGVPGGAEPPIRLLVSEP